MGKSLVNVHEKFEFQDGLVTKSGVYYGIILQQGEILID